jgi:SAM-dependent methyltransferase
MFFLGTDCSSPLPFAINTFDFVISDNVFEHAPNLKLLLADIYRVLMPGGALVVKWNPNWSSPRGHHIHEDMLPSFERSTNETKSSYKNDLTYIPPWGHLLYKKDKLRSILKERKAFASDKILDQVIQYIYEENNINRLMIDDVFDIVRSFNWTEIEHLKCHPAFNHKKFEHDKELIQLKEMYGKNRNFNIGTCYITATK